MIEHTPDKGKTQLKASENEFKLDNLYFFVKAYRLKDNFALKVKYDWSLKKCSIGANSFNFVKIWAQKTKLQSSVFGLRSSVSVISLWFWLRSSDFGFGLRSSVFGTIGKKNMQSSVFGKLRFFDLRSTPTKNVLWFYSCITLEWLYD